MNDKANSCRSLAGMAMGMVAVAGAGALSGSLVDYGVNDDFVKKLRETIPSGSSALCRSQHDGEFVLFRDWGRQTGVEAADADKKAGCEFLRDQAPSCVYLS